MAVAVIPTLAALVLYGIANTSREVQYKRASVDGRWYLVSNREDSQTAANVLATVARDLETLVSHVDATFPDDPAYRRLVSKFNAHAISEGVPGSGYTSYTVDKGARIVLCIRQTDMSFVPKNVIMYVAVHELAHVMSSTIGHTDEFWSNFEKLLQLSTELQIYDKTDFSNAPKPYCGIHITS